MFRQQVLIVRPQPGLDETSLAVEKLGWKSIHCPLMTVNRLILPPVQEPVQAIIVTSSQAVPTLYSLASKQKHEPPIVAVGHRTAQRLRQAGFQKIISADGTAVDLFKMIRHLYPADRGALLLTAGVGQSARLDTMLQDCAYTVIRRDNYEVHEVHNFSSVSLNAINQNQVAAIMFFSKRSCLTFLKLLPVDYRLYLKAIRAIVISHRCMGVVNVEEWYSIHCASHPDSRHMLACLGKPIDYSHHVL